MNFNSSTGKDLFYSVALKSEFYRVFLKSYSIGVGSSLLEHRKRVVLKRVIHKKEKGTEG